MMAQFWIGAALLSVAALAFVMVPLWRQRRITGGWSRLGSWAAALLVPSAAGLYLGIGTWAGQLSPGAAALSSMTELVESLDAQLREQPDDPVGWYLLGQSYMTLGRYADARRAFREGLARDPAPEMDMKPSFAATAETSPRTLLGEAGPIFEEALEAEPANPTARLEIKLRISLGEEFEATGAATSPGAALFIFARPVEGGPPVAVIRGTASAIPGEFSLSDANNMLPGGPSLADFDALTIVARISASGRPTEQSGDFYGEVLYKREEGSGTVTLVIDRVAR